MEILLKGVYPEELKTGTCKNICMPMFIASLFTIPVIEMVPEYRRAWMLFNSFDFASTTHCKVDEMGPEMKTKDQVQLWI